MAEPAPQSSQGPLVDSRLGHRSDWLARRLVLVDLWLVEPQELRMADSKADSGRRTVRVDSLAEEQSRLLHRCIHILVGLGPLLSGSHHIRQTRLLWVPHSQGPHSQAS